MNVIIINCKIIMNNILTNCKVIMNNIIINNNNNMIMNVCAEDVGFVQKERMTFVELKPNRTVHNQVKFPCRCH